MVAPLVAKRRTNLFRYKTCKTSTGTSISLFIVPEVSLALFLLSLTTVQEVGSLKDRRQPHFVVTMAAWLQTSASVK